MHELLRSGVIGELRHLELHVLRRRPAAVAGKGGANWRTDRAKAGGGILVDHGWHNLYLLAWLMGAAPTSMDSILLPFGNGLADEEATCLLRFGAPTGGAAPGRRRSSSPEGGAQASALMHLSWRAPLRAQWGIAYGRAGSVELQDDRLVLRRGEEPPKTFQFPQKLSAGSAHPEWFAAMLPDFRVAIERPAAVSETLAEAGVCAALIERAYHPEILPLQPEAIRR
jgi:predicted dehydrogenase